MFWVILLKYIITEGLDHTGDDFCILSLKVLYLGKDIMVASILIRPKGSFFFQIKRTDWGQKMIMVALMLKIKGTQEKVLETLRDNFLEYSK